VSTLANTSSVRPQLWSAGAATLLMIGAFFAAMFLTPSLNWFDELGRPELDRIVPHEFGDWKDTGRTPLELVNPEQGEQLRIIYNQTLARTYVHRPTGRVIMLSLAHGADQAYATQLHRPEMCYRAQGFFIAREASQDLATPIGTIKISRLWTRAGARNEPVSYWVRTGDRVTRGSLQMNLERIGLALRGFVADGLLFRVSEISRDEDSSFRLQDQFMVDLLQAVPPDQRPMLIGSLGR
jgi:EpsI family protein